MTAGGDFGVSSWWRVFVSLAGMSSRVSVFTLAGKNSLGFDWGCIGPGMCCTGGKHSRGAGIYARISAHPQPSLSNLIVQLWACSALTTVPWTERCEVVRLASRGSSSRRGARDSIPYNPVMVKGRRKFNFASFCWFRLLPRNTM